MYRRMHVCGSQNFNHRYKSSEGIHLGFWDRTCTWTCGSPIKLDWVVSQPQDPAVSTYSALELEMHTKIPDFFYVGPGNRT